MKYSNLWRIPGYSPVQRLGVGSFGEVWKAIAPDGREVAVKYLLDRRNHDDFCREARILLEAGGEPFIVRILDHNLHCERPYIVMELCESTLAQQIGRLTDSQVNDVLWCLVKAVRHIHGRGGFHRDIKPHNVLLKNENGRLVPKLSDFGIARTPHPNSGMTQSPNGTPGYMAPELLRGAPYTQASDIYSLGITMLEMLTGAPRRPALRLDKPIRQMNLLYRMTDANPRNRPTIYQVEAEIQALIDVRTDPVGNFISQVSWGTVLTGAALIGLGVAVASSSEGE